MPVEHTLACSNETLKAFQIFPMLTYNQFHLLWIFKCASSTQNIF